MNIVNNNIIVFILNQLSCSCSSYCYMFHLVSIVVSIQSYSCCHPLAEHQSHQVLTTFYNALNALYFRLYDSCILEAQKLIHNTNIIMITTRSAVLTIAPTGLYITTVTTTTATTATVQYKCYNCTVTALTKVYYYYYYYNFFYG